jgi:SAM-dependent methyltransferase
MKADFERQLRRQASWLKDTWLWLLDTKISPNEGAKSKALDVGCGPGFIMDITSERLEVSGMDIDQDMVSMCTARELDAALGDAHELPFDDNSFDLVYCSFVLLGVRDPAQVVREMARVSKKWVVAMAEPDYGGRIAHPEDLNNLNSHILEGFRELGGDPYIGRKLRGFFHEAGLSELEMGVHSGIWNMERQKQEIEMEWSWVEMTASASKQDELAEIKKEWQKALADGTLFQFYPLFWTIGKKG